MKLFNDVNDEKSESSIKEHIGEKISRYQVVIISQNEDYVTQIKSILVLYNILRIDVFPIDIKEDNLGLFLDKYDVVLVDVDNLNNAELIISRLSKIIPVEAMTFAVGHHDSISFSDTLEKNGVRYLLGNLQLNDLPTLIWQGKNSIYRRQGNIITFLGCKGGVGTTYLAFQTAEAVLQQAGLPTLYIQGREGSTNIDFIIEKPIDKDGTIHQVNNNLAVKVESSNNSWDFNDDSTSKYNLVVFDHNINAIESLTHLADVFEHSNTIIIVINRDPYSIKIAKLVMEERARLISRNINIEDKRFLICLNDNRALDKKNMLSDEDIEEFIEHKIDIKRGYIHALDKFRAAKSSKDIKQIASLLTGLEESKKKNFGLTKYWKRSIFSKKSH